jgi:hypothetical protein
MAYWHLLTRNKAVNYLARTSRQEVAGTLAPNIQVDRAIRHLLKSWSDTQAWCP